MHKIWPKISAEDKEYVVSLNEINEEIIRLRDFIENEELTEEEFTGVNNKLNMLLQSIKCHEQIMSKVHNTDIFPELRMSEPYVA
jgi:hypothetical protein